MVEGTAAAAAAIHDDDDDGDDGDGCDGALYLPVCIFNVCIHANRFSENENISVSTQGV